MVIFMSQIVCSQYKQFIVTPCSQDCWKWTSFWRRNHMRWYLWHFHMPVDSPLLKSNLSIRISRRPSFESLVERRMCPATILEKLDKLEINWSQAKWNQQKKLAKILDKITHNFFSPFPKLNCLKSRTFLNILCLLINSFFFI